MESKASLCVSVVSGDHSVFGPDWIEVDTSKNLIDVLVQVAGTQVLGQQVQVIISKDSCFTESALFQLSASVGLLEKSGHHHVNFLLKESLLASSYGLAGYKKESPTVSRCIAERDIDLTKTSWSSRESGKNGILEALLTKDSTLEKYSSTRFSNPVDSSFDGVFKAPKNNQGEIDYISNWYKERTSPPLELLESKLGGGKVQNASLSPKWAYQNKHPSVWALSTTALEEDTISRPFYSLSSTSSSVSECQGIEAVQNTENTQMSATSYSLFGKTSGNWGSKLVDDVFDDPSPKDVAKESPATLNKISEGGSKASRERRTSDSDKSTDETLRYYRSNCSSSTQHRNKSCDSSGTVSMWDTKELLSSKGYKVTVDYSDVESDCNSRKSCRQSSLRSSSRSTTPSKVPGRLYKSVKDKDVGKPATSRIKRNDKENPVTHRSGIKKPIVARTLKDGVDRKASNEVARPKPFERKSLAGSRLNSLSERESNTRSVTPLRKASRGKVSSPLMGMPKRDRPRSVAENAIESNVLQRHKKKQSSNERFKVDSERKLQSESFSRNRHRSKSLDSLQVKSNIDANEELCSDSNDLNVTLDESSVISVDSIEKEPLQIKQRVVVQLSPTKMVAPTSLYISSHSEEQVRENSKHKRPTCLKIKCGGNERDKEGQDHSTVAHAHENTNKSDSASERVSFLDDRQSNAETSGIFFKPLLDKTQLHSPKAFGDTKRNHNNTSSEFINSFFWVECEDKNNSTSELEQNKTVRPIDICSPLSSKSVSKGNVTKSPKETKTTTETTSPAKDTVRHTLHSPTKGDTKSPLSPKTKFSPTPTNEEKESNPTLVPNSPTNTTVSKTAVIFLSQTTKATKSNRTFTLDDGPEEEPTPSANKRDNPFSPKAGYQSPFAVRRVTATRGLSSPDKTKHFFDDIPLEIKLAEPSTKSHLEKKEKSEEDNMESQLAAKSSSIATPTTSFSVMVDDKEKENMKDTLLNCLETEEVQKTVTDKPEDDQQSVPTRRLWDKDCGLMDQLLLASLCAFSWELRGAADSVSSKTRHLFEKWAPSEKTSQRNKQAINPVGSVLNNSSNNLSHSFHGSQQDVAGVFRNLRKVEIRLKTIEKAIEALIAGRLTDKRDEDSQGKTSEGQVACIVRARSVNWKDFKLEARRNTWKSTNDVRTEDESLSESDDNTD